MSQAATADSGTYGAKFSTGNHEEVEEWLAQQGWLRVIRFPAYTPEDNPKQPTWKALKGEASAHRSHPIKESLADAIDKFYQSAKRHSVSFLQRFG